MLYVYFQIEMGGFEARTSDLVIYHCLFFLCCIVSVHRQPGRDGDTRYG